MHERLKQRLLNYAFMFLIMMIFGKLYSVNKECHQSLSSSNQFHKHDGSDTWNLNDHQIELNIAKEIDRMKRNNEEKKVLGIFYFISAYFSYKLFLLLLLYIHD